MFPIANDMFGVHVLVKAVGVKELEVRLVDGNAHPTRLASSTLSSRTAFSSLCRRALVKCGVLWVHLCLKIADSKYLSKCRTSGQTEIFDMYILLSLTLTSESRLQ